MVNPHGFGFNAQTAASNLLQHASAVVPASGAEGSEASASSAAIAAQARVECQSLATQLRAEGVDVVLVEQPPGIDAPDAVFPNNWLSFHADGSLIVYPMLAPSRRRERDERIIGAACERSGFEIRRRIDWSVHERAGRFLEGTGSLVLDHQQRIAFAAESPRTDAGLVREWARLMDYEPLLFSACDTAGRPYYHTNVVLWIGNRVAAVCSEAIAPGERAVLLRRLADGGRDVLEISRTQVAAFAGNMLELASWDESLGDCSLLVMSHTARASLPVAEYRRLAGAVDSVLVAPVPTIERIGGGSVRCMLAEIPAVAAA